MSAWLALASLLIQLVATIGHFHPEDFAFYGGTTALMSARPAIAAQPGGPSPSLPSHDDCSLCFSLQLAGSSTMPLAAVLPVPIALHGVPREILPELRLAAAPYLLFQTRAPPIA